MLATGPGVHASVGGIVIIGAVHALCENASNERVGRGQGGCTRYMLVKIKDDGDSEEDEEGHYSKSEEEGETTHQIAVWVRVRVGGTGRVQVTSNLWAKLGPTNPPRAYKRPPPPPQKQKGPP